MTPCPRFLISLLQLLLLIVAGFPVREAVAQDSAAVSAPANPGQLVIDGKTIRLQVQSGWQFTPDEARADADARLLDLLWPLALAVEPALSEASRRELPQLWIASSAVRRDRLEDRARDYGNQTRHHIELELPTHDLHEWVKPRAPVPKFGVVAALVLFACCGLVIARWIDGLTNGHFTTAIEWAFCFVVFFLGVVSIDIIW